VEPVLQAPVPHQSAETVDEVPRDLGMQKRPTIAHRSNGRGQVPAGNVLQDISRRSRLDGAEGFRLIELVGHDDDFDVRNNPLDLSHRFQFVAVDNALVHEHDVGLELTRQSDCLARSFGFTNDLHTLNRAELGSDAPSNDREIFCQQYPELFHSTFPLPSG